MKEMFTIEEIKKYLLSQGRKETIHYGKKRNGMAHETNMVCGISILNTDDTHYWTSDIRDITCKECQEYINQSSTIKHKFME